MGCGLRDGTVAEVLWISVPVFRSNLPAGVKELTDTVGIVALILEPAGEGVAGWNHVAPSGRVAVDSGSRGPHAGEKGSAARIADRRGGVGPGEGHASGSESIDVRRDRLMVTIQMIDPVVQIIDGDE